MIQEEKDADTGFQKELEGLINKYSIENRCDMPDFILAQMLVNLIRTLGYSIKRNLDWHGTDSVCHHKGDLKENE